jgi:hypothetical protein
VICWALVLAAPFIAIPTIMVADARLLAAPVAAWAGFAYVSVVSMFLGFFAWYRGLALGGIAAVGQVQLVRPSSSSRSPQAVAHDDRVFRFGRDTSFRYTSARPGGAAWP